MVENIEKQLEVKDILLERDFGRINITALKTFGIIMDKVYESTRVLYDDRENIYENDDAYELLESKIFAGKITIKYWCIAGINRDNNREYVKHIIESWDFYGKDNIKELEDKIKNKTLDNPTPYVCIKKDEDNYLLRFIVPCGNKKNDDGISNTPVRQYKNVICFINIKYGYIEIRTESTYADRVMDVLKYRLQLQGTSPVIILREFENNIEKFKDAFESAKLVNSKSIPDFDVDISEEDSQMLVEVLAIIDDYFNNDKDEEILKDLKNIEFEDNCSSLISTLLAGLSSIGISTRKTDIRDVTNQPMYKIIDPYLTHQLGKLQITIAETGETYPLQVSMKHNSLAFKSELTNESFIKIVRNKILKIRED